MEQGFCFSLRDNTFFGITNIVLFILSRFQLSAPAQKISDIE